MQKNYILQIKEHGAICGILTLYNACIYYGMPYPEYPSDLWEEYLDLAGAQHGPANCWGLVVAHLGLVAESLDLHGPDWKQVIADNVPVFLDVFSPSEGGTALHCVLVIEADDEGATLVNYRSSTGPVIERLPWGDEPPMKPYKPSKFVIELMHKDGYKDWPGPNPTTPDRSVKWQAIYLHPQGNPNRRAYAIRPISENS